MGQYGLISRGTMEFIKVNKLSDLESVDKSSVVFVKEDKCIYAWNGSEWKKITLPTAKGM